MRLMQATRVFFRVLFDEEAATRVTAVLEGPVEAPEPAPAPAPPKPRRSEALTLLAALQREARFVDIVKEPLEGYTDGQIGAAARDVLKDCSTVLERFFDLRPLVDHEEGSDVETPQPYDAGSYRVTGNVQGEPPYRGRLTHHGWQATRCELPQWSGSEASSQVVAPVELELE